MAKVSKTKRGDVGNEQRDVGLNSSHWSDLPLELLVKIYKHLNTETDLCRLRAICRSWRSALPQSTRRTILSNLNRDLVYPDSPPTFRYYIRRKTTYLVRNRPTSSLAPQVWFTELKELKPNQWFHMKSTITGCPEPKSFTFYLLHNRSFMKSEEHSHELPVSESKNLIDHSHAVEVARHYALEITDKNFAEYKPKDLWLENLFKGKNIILKVVLLHDHLVAGQEELVILALYEGGKRLALWKSSFPGWSLLDFECPTDYLQDIYSCGREFFAQSRQRKILAIDHKKITMSNVDTIGRLDGSYRYKVMYHKERVYVIGFTVNTNPKWVLSTVVFTLEKEVGEEGMSKRALRPVKSLGDQVFFLGRNSGFGLQADEIGWPRGDYICFHGDLVNLHFRQVDYSQFPILYDMQKERSDFPAFCRNLFSPPSNWFDGCFEY